ncbi:hypothetical protein ACOMHN_037735 [Nucella lapillus]
MRENKSQKPRKVHPNQGRYDAMVVWKGKADKPVKRSGSLAFEVILKPAANEGTARPVSPPKSNRVTLSEDDIKLKLLKAEERRQSMEAQRLEQLARERDKAQEVMAKAAQESRQFSKQTQEKLRRSMELNKENREAQIKALQDRLREHSLKVMETCKQSDRMVEEFQEKINSKVSQKFEVYEENRQSQVQSMIKRLREHANHIQEVCQASENMGKVCEEKLVFTTTPHLTTQHRTAPHHNTQYWCLFQANHIQEVCQASENMGKLCKEKLVFAIAPHCTAPHHTTPHRTTPNHNSQHWCLFQANHIQEVCQASENMGKVCEEKLVFKMENALRNREEQLHALQERLLEHERRIEEVQRKKVGLLQAEEGAVDA